MVKLIPDTEGHSIVSNLVYVPFQRKTFHLRILMLSNYRGKEVLLPENYKNCTSYV